MKYDYLVVGAGLFGATFAYKIKQLQHDAKILIVDKHDYVGGLCYSQEISGIQTHMFGAHIFRTDDINILNWLDGFTGVYPFINSPIAIANGKVYNLPFNMNTFAQLFNVTTPEEAKKAIEATIPTNIDDELLDLESVCLSTLGTTIYETLVKEYTEKQWGKACKELPASIINRLPIRFTYNNNYYSQKYQVVIANHTKFINKLIRRSDADLILGVDGKDYIDKADNIIYTGPIDEFFNYEYGMLEYRSLKFVHKVYNVPNKQGNAVVNYTTKDVEYTRSIEHKYFYPYDINEEQTVVSYEYPCADGEKMYPIEDENNKKLYQTYLEKAESEYPNITFCGRLGSYKYYDMCDTITNAFELAKKYKKEI